MSGRRMNDTRRQTMKNINLSRFWFVSLYRKTR